MRKTLRTSLLTQRDVKKWYKYVPYTGKFTFRNPVGNRHSGDEVGYLHKNGYRYTTINSRHYRVDVLIWVYLYGHIPDEMPVHKNGIRDDNRSTNLC